MANEFKHKDPGVSLTQAEFIASDGTGHVFDSQAAGDILYASSTTALARLGVASNGNVLELSSGVPAWTASPTIGSTSWANANHAHAASNSGGSAVGTTVTVTDNESTDESNLVAFVADAGSSTGNHGLEMDGDLTYNPSTGRLTATQLAGTLQTASQTNITAVGTIATGVWEGTTVAVAQGGTGATTLNNLITLGTHTTGNYAATVANATNGGTTIANSGSESAAITVAVNLNDLSAAAVNVANDSIAIIDADGSNASTKESIADFVSAIAGANLTATSGVLAAAGGGTTTLPAAMAEMIDDGTFQVLYALPGYNGEATLNSTNDPTLVGGSFRHTTGTSSTSITASTVVRGGWHIETGSANGVGIFFGTHITAAETSGGNLSAADDWTLLCQAYLTAAAATNFMYGLADGVAPLGTGNNGIGWRMVGTGNLIGYVDNAGTETTVDSSVAPTGEIHNLKIVISGGGTTVKFFRNGSQVGSDVTTNIPSSTSMMFMGGGGRTSNTDGQDLEISTLMAYREV